MKKIITTPSIDTINLCDLEKDNYPNVGFITEGDDSSIRKGYLQMTGYKSGLYKAIAVDSWSEGNAWAHAGNVPIKNHIRYFAGKTEWFSFETPQELFRWLSEE